MGGAVKNGKVWLDSKITHELEWIRMPADTPKKEETSRQWACKFCGMKAESQLELYKKHEVMEDKNNTDYCPVAVAQWVEK